MGPVDNPHDPPCVRCRRESKECFFSATRRKKRAADSGAAEDFEPDELEVRGGRKRLRTASETVDDSHDTTHAAYPVAPGSAGTQRQPLRRPQVNTADSQTTLKDEQDDQEINTQTAAILQNAEVHNGHDALHVLWHAATHLRSDSGSSVRPSDTMAGYSPANLPPVTSPSMSRRSFAASGTRSIHGMPDSATQQRIDPILQDVNANNTAADIMSALNAWRRFKFVRSGWFSAQEGMQYIEYFYRELSPLTPIVMPDYGSPGKHAALLTDEPMLAVTILTITSRHMPLEGPGAHSRPSAIHQTLWTYLEGMINRLVWGQEQFANTADVNGSIPQSDVNPYTRTGLRTLGTVESLMLLTEWHPRSMHFPGIDDDSELLLPEHNIALDSLDGMSAGRTKGIGGQRMNTWLEPCWRSDRICWMLLSMASALAMEIGVFDQDISRHRLKNPSVSAERIATYELRRIHVKNLLLVYTTQTSGRVGLTSMLPDSYSEPALSGTHFHEPDPKTATSKDVIVHLWLKIAAIMKIANKSLFADRETTRTLIRTERYHDMISTLYPELFRWRQTFETRKDIPALMRHVLAIEYEYSRVYIHSVGLQAVVDRCGQKTTRQSSGQDIDYTTNGTLRTPATISLETLKQRYGRDATHITEVVNGCQNALRAVVEGLFPENSLRHAPVRIYFRIISVAIILLRTFALGSTEDDMAKSVKLLEGTVLAFRTSIVDDVHVASRFADLLDTLTKRIKSRFVRMARNGAKGSSRTSRAPSQSPVGYTYNQAQQSNVRGTPHPCPPNNARGGAQQPGDFQEPNLPRSRTTPVPALAIDPQDNNYGYTVMPPPNDLNSPTMAQAGYGGYGDYDFSYAANDFVDGGSDWIALPLDGLLDHPSANVTAGGYGPEIGSTDLLELLLAPQGGQGY